MSKHTLSSRQVSLIIVGFTIGAGVLTLPSAAARVLGASGWVWVFMTGLLFTGAAWVAVKLAQKFPQETIVEYSQTLLGKPLGILFSITLALFFFAFIPIETRIMQELVNISILPSAPTWFVNGVFILTMAYGASREIDQLALVNELLIEIALLVGLFVTILSWQHFKLIHLLPFLAKDQIQLHRLGEEIGTAFSYAGFPAINMILPYIRHPQKASKAMIIGSLLVTVVYTIFTISVLGVFGYNETIHLSWPGLELAKSVNLEAVILERMDLILLISWISAIFTTGALAYFLAGVTLSKVFKIKKHSMIVWALVPLIYYLSASLKNYFTWNRWSIYISVLTLVISFVAIPFLYLLALIKK